MSNTKEAVDTLTRALKEDPGYYYGWQANIAMAFHDEFLRQPGSDVIRKDTLHEVCNQAARNFLDMLVRYPENNGQPVNQTELKP